MLSGWYLNCILVITGIDQIFNVKNSLYLMLNVKVISVGSIIKSLMCSLYNVSLTLLILKPLPF